MKKIRVAIIEDNHDLNSMLVEDIRTAGYTVAGFLSVEDFDASECVADLIVVDINLPGESGFEFTERFRKTNQHVYIIALSALSGAVNRVTGYKSGIDIYLEKPTSSLEILSIIDRCAQRIQYYSSDLSGASVSKLMVMQGHFLIGTYSKILLKERERALLTYLTKAEERKLSYEDCIRVLGNEDMKQSALEVVIGRLRRKIQQVSGISRSIEAIRGTGYVLCVDLDLKSEEDN